MNDRHTSVLLRVAPSLGFSICFAVLTTGCRMDGNIQSVALAPVATVSPATSVTMAAAADREAIKHHVALDFDRTVDGQVSADPDCVELNSVELNSVELASFESEKRTSDVSAFVTSAGHNREGSITPVDLIEQIPFEDFFKDASDTQVAVVGTPYPTVEVQTASWNQSGGAELPASDSDEATQAHDKGGASSDEMVPNVTRKSVAPVVLGGTQQPIDLPAALRLAGAENWSVRLAHERIHEAQAQLAEAEALWLPSINLGVGYTQHEGKIQGTDGEVIDASRNSLFLGGGAVNSNAPIAGGSGGPARMQVDLSITDALYEPLARCQQVSAAQANQNAVFNETLSSVAIAYYDLMGAQGRLTIENQNIKDIDMILDLTQAFVAAGKAARSEVYRVSVASGVRAQSAIKAQLAVKIASAELSRLVRLDVAHMPADFVLVSHEGTPSPVEWIDGAAQLPALVSQGLAVRPEVAMNQAAVAEYNARVQAEQVRPFVPNLHFGLSGGLFSGGTGDNLTDTGGRTDVDALLVWQMKNLGYGNRAALAQRQSQQRQAVFRSHQIKDIITAEITKAWQMVQAQRKSIQLAEQNIEQAIDVFESNLERIRGLEGLPIEALQSVNALADARVMWLESVVAYNQAQVLLLQAVGRPVDSSSPQVVMSQASQSAPIGGVETLPNPTPVIDAPE